MRDTPCERARIRAEEGGGRVVLANGSTRLQLDIAKSSSLPFHALLSSELLGKAKVSEVHVR